MRRRATVFPIDTCGELMAAGELDEDDPEYQDFVKKFEAKKTTDDCYTPDVVYDDVVDWCRAHDVTHVKEYMNRGRKG